MKINKQSNIYTVIYIVILVSIVGAALAFTSMSLSDKQQDNINADKMRQILASVRISAPQNEIKATFDSIISCQLILNEEGDSIGTNAFGINMASESRKKPSDRKLPLYVAKIDGSPKYIIPVYGAGLWGPIWGYISLDADGTTIYGAYFAHEGETPGLGAEIEKPAFSDQFQGKKIFKRDVFLPVNVIKKGLKPLNGEDYVDAVSGGTITSKGVAAMIDDGLKPYKTFLETLNNRKQN